MSITCLGDGFKTIVHVSIFIDSTVQKKPKLQKKLYVSIQLPFISLKHATQKQIDSALPFYNKKSIKIFKKQK